MKNLGAVAKSWLKNSQRFVKAITSPAVDWMAGNAAVYWNMPAIMKGVNCTQVGLTVATEVAKEFCGNSGKGQKIREFLDEKVNGYMVAAGCYGVNAAISLGQHLGMIGGTGVHGDDPKMRFYYVSSLMTLGTRLA